MRANQVYICRSSIILFNSYFDEYLTNRVKTKFQLFLNLTNNEFKSSSIKIDPKDIFKADCCRIIRNIIVHQPANTFLSIKEIRAEIKQKISNQLDKRLSFLQKEYTDETINENLNKAINEVIDSAITEVDAASKRNVNLPYEFFFMLFTFTNYNAIAAQIEQVLFFDDVPKTFYNRVDRNSVSKERQEMISEPAVIGLVCNSDNNQPIQFAKIQVLDNPFNGTTDNKGNYFLTPNLKTGSYTIEIFAESYEIKLAEINTVKDKTITLDINLKPKR